MNLLDLDTLMRRVFREEILDLSRQGQKEYASNNDAFSNFKEQGEELGLDPKVILWVHAMKHKSGIASYLKGVKSQREDVRGRINDLIVYLFILRGIIEEEDSQKKMEQERREVLRDQVYAIDKATGVSTLVQKGAQSGGPPATGAKPEQKREEEKPKADQEKSSST